MYGRALKLPSLTISAKSPNATTISPEKCQIFPLRLFFLLISLREIARYGGYFFIIIPIYVSIYPNKIIIIKKK